MSVNHTIKKIDDHLSVTVTGTVSSMEDILTFGTPLLVIAEEAAIKRVLIDYRETQFIVDYFDAVLLAKHTESTKFSHRQLRIALLVSPEQLAMFEDFKTPSMNRGLLYENFIDKKTAMDWLSTP